MLHNATAGAYSYILCVTSCPTLPEVGTRRYIAETVPLALPNVICTVATITFIEQSQLLNHTENNPQYAFGSLSCKQHA